MSAWQPVATPDADATGHIDLQLPSDSQQFYRVRAVGVFADSASAWSEIASARTDAASFVGLPPTDVSPEMAADGGIAVAWADQSAGEAGFTVYRQDGEDGPFLAVGNVSADATSFTDTTVSPGIGYAYAVRAQPSTADLLQATVGSPAPQGGGASSGGPSGIGGMSAASGPIGYATAHETAPYHARFDSSFGSRPEWDVPDAEHPGILMPGDSSTLRLGDLPEHEELGLGMKFYPGELVGAAMPVGSQSKFTVKAGGTLLYRLIATAAPGEWEYGSANNYTNDITFEEEFHDSASEGQGPAGTDGLFVRLPHTGKSLTVTFQAEGGGGGAPAEFAPGATALGGVGVVVPPCDRVTLSAQQKSVLERIMYDAIEDASLAAATAASPINTGSDREDLNTKGPRFGATLLEGQADGTWDLGMEVMKSSVGVLAGQIGGLIDKLMDGVGTFEELEPHVRQQIEEILDRDFFFVQNTRSLQLGNPNYSATLEAYVNRCTGKVSGLIQGFTGSVVDINGRIPRDSSDLLYYETKFSGSVTFDEDGNPGSTSVDLL